MSGIFYKAGHIGSSWYMGCNHIQSGNNQVMLGNTRCIFKAVSNKDKTWNDLNKVHFVITLISERLAIRLGKCRQSTDDVLHVFCYMKFWDINPSINIQVVKCHLVFHISVQWESMKGHIGGQNMKDRTKILALARFKFSLWSTTEFCHTHDQAP